MLNKIKLIAILSFFVFIPFSVWTQSEQITGNLEPILEAEITSEDFIKVERKIIFDAGRSILLSDAVDELIFRWQFGDTYFDTGKEVVHQYTKTGTYEVNLILEQAGQIATSSKEIFVYDTKAVLITDSKHAEDLSLLNEQATENAVALKILSAVDETEFLSEDKLQQMILELDDYIKDSDIIIFYTRSALGLSAFARYFQEVSTDKQQILQQKTLVHVTDASMNVARNFTYQAFKVIHPKYILLTRAEAIGPIFSEKDFEQIPEVLHQRGIEYQLVQEQTQKSYAWILSHFINYLSAQGVGTNTIYLILVIPFFAFLAIFARQVIGMSSFGVYTPVMIAASFYILGLWFGLLAFLIVVIASYIAKQILNRFELLHLPKVALNLSIISLTLLIVVWIGLKFDVQISLALAIFPMLVMSTVAEKFMAAQSEEGFRGALFAVLGTLLVVVVCYYLTIWSWFANQLKSWPEWVLLPLALSVLLGKFTGLRLGEYLRFRSLFSEHIEE